LLNGIKSLSYGESAVALRYARSRGCDDVITSNSKGEVVETALANILFWDGSTWLTPTRSSGCLPGVTRELLIEYFSIQESDISVKEIQEMRSLATTSSLRDVQGVSSFQDLSGNLFSFEQEPVDRLRQSFKEWRRKNPHP
jgi:prepilin-type processing-associated H-X9-DG protein